MIEVCDVVGKFQAWLVQCPITYPDMKTVDDWYFVHAAAGSKLKSLNRSLAHWANCENELR